jgi:hypothetical protein
MDTTILVEQIEFDAEEEIDYEDQFKILSMQVVELFVNTDLEYKCYNNIRQFSISSYLEYDTPPPRYSC